MNIQSVINYSALAILASLSTTYAYSPAVAQRMVDLGLAEYQKTGSIQNLIEFKKAYQDMPRMARSYYAARYDQVVQEGGVLRKPQEGIKEKINNDKPPLVIKKPGQEDKKIAVNEEIELDKLIQTGGQEKGKEEKNEENNAIKEIIPVKQKRSISVTNKISDKIINFHVYQQVYLQKERIFKREGEGQDGLSLNRIRGVDWECNSDMNLAYVVLFEAKDINIVTSLQKSSLTLEEIANLPLLKFEIKNEKYEIYDVSPYGSVRIVNNSKEDISFCLCSSQKDNDGISYYYYSEKNEKTNMYECIKNMGLNFASVKSQKSESKEFVKPECVKDIETYIYIRPKLGYLENEFRIKQSLKKNEIKGKSLFSISEIRAKQLSGYPTIITFNNQNDIQISYDNGVTQEKLYNLAQNNTPTIEEELPPLEDEDEMNKIPLPDSDDDMNKK